jgi:hypothetical protein
MYLLNFVDNSSSCIEGCTRLLVICGGGEHDSSCSIMQLYGVDVMPTSLELHTLNATKVYKIHCDGHVIKMISFQVATSMVVVCE